ncbi:hypothetical protein QYM36_014176, partial [Artemia franciscana]
PMEVDETSTVNASNAEVPNSVVVSLPTQPAEPQIDFNKWELAPPGSNFSIEQSSLEKVQEHQKYESPNDMFNAFFQYELSVYESSSQSQEDRRVDNFACYLVANGFMKFIQLACLVMMNRFLALTSADGNREHLLLLEITTNELNNQLKVLRPEEADELTSLNNSYKGFLIDVYAFIYAVECIQKLHRYDECIPVLSRVYFDGRADRELGENRRINTSVIFACLRKALQELNAIYISKFRAGKGSDQLIGEFQWSFVPGLVVLSQSKDKEDEGVVERLPGSWCALFDGIAARGVAPARVYRDEEGKADKEPWERLSNRTSNDDVEQRNMSGLGGRLDDRDNKRMRKMNPDGMDWNFQDSHQFFVGNIPPNIVESDLKECFGAIAKVVDVKINSSTRSAAKYGFVAFETAEIVQQVLKKRPIYYKSHQFNVEEKTQQRSFLSRTKRRDKKALLMGGSVEADHTLLRSRALWWKSWNEKK